MPRKKTKKNQPRKDLSYKKRGVIKAKRKATRRKSNTPKPRNNGTMTESAFWSWIRSGLRQKSRFWRPIQAVKKSAERPYIGPDKRRKFEYKCSECSNWFPGKEVSVHHIEPAGTLSCAADLPGFVERLFCEKEGLRVLCNCCHGKEHENLKVKAA